MSYVMRISDDTGRGFEVEATLQTYRIGRAVDNEICLSDRNVSRRHALIHMADEGFTVEDLGSYTGVFVNGERVYGRHFLKIGDRIRIGDYLLAYHPLGSEIEETREHRLGHDNQPMDSDAVPVPGMFPEAGDKPEFEEPTSDYSAEFDGQTGQLTQAELSPEKDLEKPRLAVISSVFAGYVFPLSEGLFTIGRVDENDIVIEHRSVSRRHATIEVKGGQAWVSDLDSVNGVLLNDAMCESERLFDGDVIELGRVRLRYVSPGVEFELTEEEIQSAWRKDIEDDDGRGKRKGLLGWLKK